MNSIMTVQFKEQKLLELSQILEIIYLLEISFLSI
jgi:hypothetical protein